MVFEKFQDAGVLTYEILNMIKMCNPIFDAFHFSEEMEDDSYWHMPLSALWKNTYKKQMKRKP